MVASLAALLLGYLVGSFPSAYLVARLKGRNIFEVGSGNMGAMNTARNLGYGLGLLVLALDIGKGALASLLGLWLSSPDTPLPALLAGLGAVAGHAWSLFLRFRGGKALATALGASLPLYPLGGLAALALIVVLTLSLKKRSVLAAVITVILYPFIVTATSWRATPPVATFLCVCTIAAVVLLRHLPSLRAERRALRAS